MALRNEIIIVIVVFSNNKINIGQTQDNGNDHKNYDDNNNVVDWTGREMYLYRQCFHQGQQDYGEQFKQSITGRCL